MTNSKEQNGYELIDATLELWYNRHRKLTLDRIIEETGLPHSFVDNFPIFKMRRTRRPDRIVQLYEYLKKYEENPHLL